MKAIILNSGIGKRMRPFTDTNPKCFAKLNGDTILEHEIKHLVHYGITDFIITVGPFEEKIKKLVKAKFPTLNVSYPKNPKFEATNYIYSIWLARESIDDDVLLLHGDMVFEGKLLKKLLDAPYENAVLMNNKVEPPEKDFKGRVDEGIVKEIGVKVTGEHAYFLPPIYKFSKNGFQLWLSEMGKFVERNELSVYAENAFNNIPDKIKLHPVYFGDEFCMEIDDFGDLEIARKFFKGRK